ncbi:MAG: HrcA family transcriptional regulator [Synechococcaceae bacterium WB8_1B_136]|nr:HrcA family transcriptional regulator [Synechococcaceae bacterium WB8_1B_136]
MTQPGTAVQPLPRRQQQVLQATVRHYVDTTEPVGSQTLVRRFGLEASPATVRSAMGALEQKGLLTQPHTSAGRVPSQQGYRHYVDCLLPPPGATAGQLQRELTGLSLQWAALDDLLLHLARRLADLTGLLSLITRPQRRSDQLQALRLVPSGDRLLVLVVENAASASTLNLRRPNSSSEELQALEHWACTQLEQGQLNWSSLPPQLRLSGELLRQGLASHQQARPAPQQGAVAMGLGGLLSQPEFSRSQSLRPLLQLVEDQPYQVLQSPGAASRGGVWIGAEHPHPALRECAVVQAPYCSGSGDVGHVALVGPMRMAYATACAAVSSVAARLERLLG